MGKRIVFDSYKTYEVASCLASHFNTRITEESVELKVTVPARHGSGEITALDFHDGISMLIFDVQLKDELSLSFNSKEEQPLRLLFGVEGEVAHSVRADGLDCRLGSLRCTMVCGKSGSEEMFQLQAAKSTVFYCIEVDRKKYRTKISKVLSQMPDELRRVFEDARGRYPFFYTGTYHLGIAQCIQNIRNNGYQGAVRRVYAESQTLEIMSLLLKQFIEDLSPQKTQRVLHKRDMELITEARKKLLMNLAQPPTIRELAQMMGTNENKLKAGFRVLYGTSINKLLQDERLSKAKLLIAEEAYPIKEIAKMVGYKHSAHFASKFKKRFGILPNAYLKSVLK